MEHGCEGDGTAMGVKVKVKVNIRTLIRCPHCQEAYEKPPGGVLPANCPYCARPLAQSAGTMEEAGKEALSAAAATFESIAAGGGKTAARAWERMPATLLNALGAMVVCWTMFVPAPYLAAVVACACVPLVALAVMAGRQGWYHFETLSGSKSTAPALTIALAGPPLALAWRALNDFHILAFAHAWLPAAVAALCYAALLYAWAADIRKKRAYLLMALVFGFAYGYGAVILGNCLLDRSVPVSYAASVLGKRSSYTAEIHSYYITVSPWGPWTAPREISIRKAIYDRFSVRDNLVFLVRGGRLGIPWFIIRTQRW